MRTWLGRRRVLWDAEDSEKVRDEQIGFLGEKLADMIVESALYRAPDKDFAMGVVHAAWVHLTCELALIGWTPEELLKDCGWHAANITSRGGVH